MLDKLISGGQTGVDWAALGRPIGGGCPIDRSAEDGVIPAGYRLAETPERNYQTRTRRNVEDSDGTLNPESGHAGRWYSLDRCPHPPNRQAVSGDGAGGGD